MSWPLAAFLFVCAGFALFHWWAWRVRRERLAFINGYQFPPGLFDRLARKRPDLKQEERRQVDAALRQYFRAYLNSGFKFVSMPSQLADDLWHEFILYTRNYQNFCKKAFGRFLHHTPAVVLSPAQRKSNVGLRRVWWQACKEEGIDPRKPSRLPVLFALDGNLNIADGFLYAADCAALRQGGGAAYCGGDFADSGFDGGTEGFGESPSDSSADGGDGGGDGGDGGGCGGGCGGGGD